MKIFAFLIDDTSYTTTTFLVSATAVAAGSELSEHAFWKPFLDM